MFCLTSESLLIFFWTIVESCKRACVHLHKQIGKKMEWRFFRSVRSVIHLFHCLTELFIKEDNCVHANRVSPVHELHSSDVTVHKLSISLFGFHFCLLVAFFFHPFIPVCNDTLFASSPQSRVNPLQCGLEEIICIEMNIMCNSGPCRQRKENSAEAKFFKYTGCSFPHFLNAQQPGPMQVSVSPM